MRSRAEVEEELASVREQQRKALMPDGGTGLTKMSFGDLRRSLRAREAQLVRELDIIDAGGSRGGGTRTRDY